TGFRSKGECDLRILSDPTYVGQFTAQTAFLIICAPFASHRSPRRSSMLTRRMSMLGGLLLGAVTVVLADSGFLTNLFPFQDPTGILKTFNTTGKVDLTGPFFQSLGTNGRSCGTCHQASDAWTVSAAHVADRFEATDGLDPIFRPNDGSNCDTLDTSTVDARRQAYSLLISRGLIRIFLPVPDGAEFHVVSHQNHHGGHDESTLSIDP